MSESVGLYCLRDRVARRYFAPSVELNDNVAIRNFAELINGDKHYTYIAKDLDLYQIGQFSYENGQIVVCDPVFMVNGLDCVVNDDEV